MDIRIMTFNIQHCRSHSIMLREKREVIDPTIMTDVISRVGADVCGLNEVRGYGVSAQYTPQAEAIAAILGYHGIFGRSIYVNGTEPYGNGLISRFPICKMEIIPIPEPSPAVKQGHGEPRSILRCELDIGGGFVIYQSHFGLDRPAQKIAASAAHDLFQKEKLPAVFMGDFNMTPDDEYLIPLHRDFVSTDPMLEGKLTYPSDDPKIKIDYIFANRLVTVHRCEVVDVVASDHRPVWADISF